MTGLQRWRNNQCLGGDIIPSNCNVSGIRLTKFGDKQILHMNNTIVILVLSSGLTIFSLGTQMQPLGLSFLCFCI